MLEHLTPQRVFKHFEDLTKIPHGSGNEKAISDFVFQYAKNLGLSATQDEAMNVIIKKPASLGYEDCPPVLLQGHLDMVCEKNKSVIHDFMKDPLPIYIEGDFIKSKGTTLGADNGIAIAYMMAILEDASLAHPQLICIMTTVEENGMDGASSLDASHLNAPTLINIDSEEEGVVLLSCAGGVRNKLCYQYEGASFESPHVYKVNIDGLMGGHSGMDINKGRENANKVMGRILAQVYSFAPFRILSISGGTKMNAIPREAEAIILPVAEDSFLDTFKKIAKNFEEELNIAEKDFKISIMETNANTDIALSLAETNQLLNILLLIPNGVQTMSILMPNLVESSTNLGIVSTVSSEKKVIFESALRSSSSLKKEFMKNAFHALSQMGKLEIIFNSDYPAWPVAPNSAILKIFEDTYKKMFQTPLKKDAIHAGLECGIFAGKKENLDMISFGPNMYDVHSPNERLSISSAEKMYKFLLEVLKNMKA